jgi:hypothetical protein
VLSSLRQHVDTALRDGKANEYDSHPPLRERLAALEALAGDDIDAAEPMASTLLRDLDRLEADFLRSIFIDPSKVAALQAIEWRDTGTQVYLPKWRESIARTEILRGVGSPASSTRLRCHFSGQL